MGGTESHMTYLFCPLVYKLCTFLPNVSQTLKSYIGNSVPSTGQRYISMSRGNKPLPGRLIKTW